MCQIVQKICAEPRKSRWCTKNRLSRICWGSKLKELVEFGITNWPEHGCFSKLEQREIFRMICALVNENILTEKTQINHMGGNTSYLTINNRNYNDLKNGKRKITLMIFKKNKIKRKKRGKAKLRMKRTFNDDFECLGGADDEYNT
eukprot:UN22074